MSNEVNDLPDLVDLLRAAVSSGASDVHLCSDLPPSMRVRGEIFPCSQRIIGRQECREMILGILTDSQRSRLERDLELDFGLQISGTGRFRGNAHFSRSALEAAFRYIPEGIPELSQLGHRPSVSSLCDLDKGLVLVTGMTGSGKTTTLASMIRRISETRSGVIVTIEDPIEFYFPSSRSIIKQRELGTDTKSFDEALRHVLRQDPDVIMVGEMRDPETVRAALTAAETGHLVLATLHTNDAPQALDRIVDNFPGDEQQQILGQLANALAAVLAQRLVPSEDGLSRVMVSELLTNNSAVSACIRDRRLEQVVGLMEIGRKDGMHTFDDVLEELYLAGSISKEEALAGARDASRIEVLRRVPRKGSR
jgi:twitching motility protein PilT